jgi:hypothetical protein
MRQKRQKSYKRMLRLYATAFYYKAPYKILCAGDFIHTCFKQKIPMDEQLPKTFIAETQTSTLIARDIDGV